MRQEIAAREILGKRSRQPCRDADGRLTSVVEWEVARFGKVTVHGNGPTLNPKTLSPKP